MRDTLLFVMLLLLAPLLACANTQERLMAAVLKAADLARAGKDADATALLDKVLKASPGMAPARLMRAKLRFRAKQFEEAEEDAKQVMKEAPETRGARELLAKIRENIKPQSVTMVGAAAAYSEWQWSWVIDGKKPFKLAEYLGGEGHTLFFWTARPGQRDEYEKYENDSSGDRAYFLRVVELKGGPDGAANVALPGASAHEVATVPYMMLVTGEGAVAAKGAPAEVEPKLAEIRKARRAARAQVAEAIVTEDVANSDPPLAGFAAAGYTTIVMMTSLACPPCRAIKPKVKDIPNKHPSVRVVIAEIGVTAQGGINWESPFFKSKEGVGGVPFFYVIDSSGQVTKSGSAADAIGEWLGN